MCLIRIPCGSLHRGMLVFELLSIGRPVWGLAFRVRLLHTPKGGVELGLGFRDRLSRSPNPETPFASLRTHTVDDINPA